MPEKVLIHWVIIKEPNEFTKSKGRIYVLLETAGEPKSSLIARFFGYRREKVEPRLHGLEYDRGLHELLEKEVMPKLRSGQPVVGRLEKTGKDLRRGPARDGKEKGKGDGSESQKQKWEFHKLLPSEIHWKPAR